MTNDRITALSSDLYDYAFRMIDGEHDAKRDDAGRIATAVQKAFEYSAYGGDYAGLADRIICDAEHDGTLEYGIDVCQDDAPVRGNASASGDDYRDRNVEDVIIARLEGGDVWAWATVSVTCRVPGHRAFGVDHLGCCSYANEDGFKSGGYYDDMCSESRQALKVALAEELAR